MEEVKKEIKVEEKPSLISEADKAAERLEKANAELKSQLDRQEQLMVKERLGGRSFAGEIPKVETDDEKMNKKINAMFKGTGLNPLK